MHYVAIFSTEEDGDEQELNAEITLAQFGHEIEIKGIYIYWEQGDFILQWKYGTPSGFEEDFLRLNDCQKITSQLWLGCFECYEAAEAWTETMIEIHQTDLSDRQFNLVGWQYFRNGILALS